MSQAGWAMTPVEVTSAKGGMNTRKCPVYATIEKDGKMKMTVFVPFPLSRVSNLRAVSSVLRGKLSRKGKRTVVKKK